VFSRLDTNQDGKIDAEELAAFAEEMGGITGQTLNSEELLAEFDSDSDGLLSEEEAVSLLENLRPEPPEAATDQTKVQNTNAVSQYLSVLSSTDGGGNTLDFEI